MWGYWELTLSDQCAVKGRKLAKAILIDWAASKPNQTHLGLIF